jgi:ubiquinone/menaquinone biosynthesis C-methylase UbiE
MNIRKFWEEYSRREKFHFGKETSLSAVKAVKIFREYDVRDILDVGCGYGRDSIYFYNEEFNVVGIDYSENAIATGRKLLEKINADESRIRLEVCDANNLPFEDESFDAKGNPITIATTTRK